MLTYRSSNQKSSILRLEVLICIATLINLYSSTKANNDFLHFSKALELE